MRRLRKNHDFSDFGKAIKSAREAKGIKREPAAEALDLSPRYLMALENNGKNPSGQVLVALAKMFDVSIDQYIFSDEKTKKTSQRRHLESLLNSCSEKDLLIITATTKAILESKTAEEE